MSDYICPFFADEEQSDSEEATSPRGSEYSFSLLFRGESASEPATPGARSPGALSDYFRGGGTPAATPRRSLFSDTEAKEPAARPWFATSTAPQNVPPPKQKSTTQSVLEAVGLAAPEPEPEPKSRTRAVLEATGLVSPAPEPKEESASYF